MNVKSYTFIGTTYLEIVKAFFKAISEFNNITAEGGSSISGGYYEYFTVADQVSASVSYRFCLYALTSNSQLRAGYANVGQTGGSMVAYQDINAGSYSKYKSYGGRLYSHCRIFYDDSNNFIGTTGLYAENFSSPWWFAIVHAIDGTPIWLKQGTGEITTPYDLVNKYSWANLFDEGSDDGQSDDGFSVNNETSDTVYIDVPDYRLPDVYRIYNNTFFYTQNATKVCKGLLYINTEAGQFISLRANIWFKIDNVGVHTTVIYNG